MKYDGVGFLADSKCEIFDSLHGDVGLDSVFTQANGDNAIDGTLLDVLDGALELVACTDLHNRYSFLGGFPEACAVISCIPHFVNFALSC